MHEVLFVGLSPGFQKTILFDHFAVGQVSRSKKYWLDISGKCINSARVFAQLEGNASCLTQICESDCNKFLEMAKVDGLNLIAVPANVSTRYCYTIVDEAAGTSTELVVNETGEIHAKVEEEFFKRYCDIIDQYKTVVINGSRLSGFSDKIIPDMLRFAKNKDKTVFADYRRDDLKNSMISNIIRPDYIKINMDEFKETFINDTCNQNVDIRIKLKELTEYYCNTIILTQGADETLFSECGKIKSILPKQVIKPVNPIGCGDAFLAGLVMGIINGESLEKAINLGCDCAEKNVLNIRPGSIK